jgi:hypothetical protein
VYFAGAELLGASVGISRSVGPGSGVSAPEGALGTGVIVGSRVGAADIVGTGTGDGLPEGTSDGKSEGTLEGAPDGTRDGASEGMPDGPVVGVSVR